MSFLITFFTSRDTGIIKACLKEKRMLITCGHVKDMGHGEILCDLIETGENRVCFLQRGLECGLNRVEPVEVTENRMKVEEKRPKHGYCSCGNPQSYPIPHEHDLLKKMGLKPEEFKQTWVCR